VAREWLGSDAREGRRGAKAWENRTGQRSLPKCAAATPPFHPAGAAYERPEHPTCWTRARARQSHRRILTLGSGVAYPPRWGAQRRGLPTAAEYSCRDRGSHTCNLPGIKAKQRTNAREHRKAPATTSAKSATPQQWIKTSKERGANTPTTARDQAAPAGTQAGQTHKTQLATTYNWQEGLRESMGILWGATIPQETTCTTAAAPMSRDL
jgi:hypothetical protein